MQDQRRVIRLLLSHAWRRRDCVQPAKRGQPVDLGACSQRTRYSSAAVKVVKAGTKAGAMSGGKAQKPAMHAHRVTAKGDAAKK